MYARSIECLLLVTAVFLVISVASLVVVNKLMRPASLFAYLVTSTIFSGVLTSVIIEQINTSVRGF
jgi:hypothetical protein